LRLLPEALGRELWQKCCARPAELSEAEFAEALEAIGGRYNFGLEPGRLASEKEREGFWRALHSKDLALALGCALGREAAWQRFMNEYRGPLTRAAVGVTRSTGLGEELADGLYAELYGIADREGARRSPLERYSGRGSLMGWLRAMLAQRHVDHYRKTHRETALEDVEPAAPEAAPPETRELEHLREALPRALGGLDAEERFLLSAYYLDGHTLVELSRVLRVHEATISRKLKRAAGHVRKELLRALAGRGLSRRAAEEALRADPRDVDVNLRKLLQIPGDRTYSDKEGRG
jgi:RNA polymerase sigma-70 factor (ECF subfamily)